MEFKHSDKYRKFGLNVAYYRKDRRFTQEGLAEAVGADRSTIAKIERSASSRTSCSISATDAADSRGTTGQYGGRKVSISVFT